jgi:hypothetical protein
MRKCLAKQICSISRRTIGARPFSTTSTCLEQDGERTGKVTPVAAHLRHEGIAGESIDGGLDTSSHGENESSETFSSRLPISPLMDPSFWAARQKHRLPKQPPTKKPTPFQRQLANNPYAQALATPMRMCTMTRTGLPSYFLQDFELIAHPETGDPWYMPRSLTSKHSSPTPMHSVNESGTAQSADSTSTTGSFTRHGPRAYVLSRAELLEATNARKGPFANPQERFPNKRELEWKVFRDQKIGWREDMDQFVLELMRRRVGEGLQYLQSLKKGYLVRCKDWEEAKNKKQVAAVLWLGAQEHAKADIESDAASTDGPGHSSAGVVPHEFATLDLNKQPKSKLPVHNLPQLLGAAHLKKLRDHAPEFFKSELIAVKQRNATVDIQLRLWKLQGYIAKHADVIE